MTNPFNFLTIKQRTNLRACRRVVEVLIIAGALYGAGGVTGYWVSDNQARQDRLALANEHNRELERTNSAYAKSLQTMDTTMQILVSRINGAAQTSEAAAQVSEAAANTAQKAAVSAQKAVTQSTIAINKAGQAPEPSREQINRSVQRANGGLK